MTTNWNELNVSRAQWSIDSYCLGNTDKKCQPCQKGWNLTEPSCYASNYLPYPGWKTWEEAQEDCKGKNSDLAVAHNPDEKEAINTNSFGPHGFWIGLRVEDGEWKWVDGSDLTDSSWIAAPVPVDGLCALFYRGKWLSVHCEEITGEADYVNAPEGPADKKATRPVTFELSGNNAELFSRIQELDSRIQELFSRIQELETQNQELETRENNLTQKIQDMTTNWNELNVSRAQWSIDSYCLGNTDKKCKACQKGWLLTEPSCYAYIDAQSPNRKTWEEAREDCKGRNSDLAVAHDSEEKEAINTNSFGPHGFWIGLRVEDGEWKWVDGSDLTDSSWIAAPFDVLCAVLYKGKWVSVSCGEKHQWICQKKALSV
ncbi:hypothetical protein JOQ06_026223 [Pogonophryne albipinna]|uniref:C-type lectin domain-containing protein n=1 Tax=Pogonophryne albipinna TaxID=1090488 RepID=A0AAD6AAE2_9TELE|nr:hypothetical protein JOQ06_026223 [Pogonophryne albipinna]